MTEGNCERRVDLVIVDHRDLNTEASPSLAVRGVEKQLQASAGRELTDLDRDGCAEYTYSGYCHGLIEMSSLTRQRIDAQRFADRCRQALVGDRSRRA